VNQVNKVHENKHRWDPVVYYYFLISLSILIRYANKRSTKEKTTIGIQIYSNIRNDV
jgi:hypothetical protein